jgi:UDP-N-acetyl-D-glucosamine dehydrogenase
MVQVAIIGQGYVGLPLAIAAAQAGHTVLGIDSNRGLISTLANGRSPIGDVSDEAISQALASGRYQPTASFELVAKAEIVILCVPTPLTSDYKPDLSHLESALQSLSPYLAPNTLVINESTVAPGTTRSTIATLLSKTGLPFELAYSPERIDPANKTWNVTNTPKLVAGLTEAATERAAAFYRTFITSVTTGSSLEVIETAKLLENSFRLVNISFINEIAQFCAALKIDVREVIDAATTKPYGFMPFYPGAGVGGHCIPVDPKYLSSKADELGIPSRFIDLAHELNLSLPSYFTGVATGMLGSLEEKKIIVIGVAYKPDVADVRETPAEQLITTLRQSGAAVSWHDDLVQIWNSETSVPLTNTYDLAILINPHSHCDLSLLGSTPLLNTRGGY